MAVVANNVYFSHEKVTKSYTLNGVNMCVPYGSIYGLLGPSGCGKTTLLKCVIGLLQPSLGNISLFGYKPGSELSGVPGGGIGYMPQDLAVQYDLTIEEILTYFGKLNSVESKHLSNEIDALVKKLDLYNKHKLIGQLSGGQKRRVSLAITLLHRPRLVILDEPTVGVDPVLIEVIWNMLRTLSTQQETTIIITTHYINEAKRADRVAFMRKGFILEENHPRVLLKKYETQRLDDVFLKLCSETKRRKSSCLRPLIYKHRRGSLADNVEIPFQQRDTNSVKKFITIVYSIIWKFMIETRRNPQSMFLVLGTTLSIILSVKFAVGQTPHDLKIAWVIEEPYNYSDYLQSSLTTLDYSELEENANTQSTNYSNSFAMTGSDGLIEIAKTTNNNNDETSELYLPEILKKSINSKIIKLIEYPDLLSAMKDAKKAKIRGIIHLKSNFSKSYLDCDPLFTEVEGDISSGTVDSGSIHLYLDLAKLVIAETIRAVVTDSIQKFRKTIAVHFAIDQNALSLPVIIQPINFEEDHPITSVEDIFSVATFITPGIVVLNSFSACIGLSVLSLIIASECDMFVREYAAGVNALHRVFGQVIARFIFMFFNAVFNLLAIVYFLHVPCRGSVALILILMWMQMLLGLTLGIFMSSFMTNAYFSLYMALSFTMLLLTSNGLIWGIEAQPYYMKWLMTYSPLYYSSKTLREMLIYSQASFQVIWPGFAMTAFWIAVAFAATVYFIAQKK